MIKTKTELKKPTWLKYTKEEVVAIVKKLAEKDITSDLLNEKGLINKNRPYKILANGSIDKPMNISANMFSKKAIEKIEKAGGEVITG